MKHTIQKRLLAGLLSLAVTAFQVPDLLWGSLRAAGTQQPCMSLSAFRSAVNTLCAKDAATAGVPVTADTSDRFQTSRLLVQAAGAIDTSGATEVIEGYGDLHILQYASPAAAEAAYTRFQAAEGVTSVEPSVYLNTSTAEETTANAVADHPSLHTNWGAEYIGSDIYRAYLAQQGTLPAVTVAVIDTGINDEYPVFAGRIAAGGADFTQSGNWKDTDGHGTQVAGIICDLTPENVKVLPLKAMQSADGATTETVYAALQYAAAQNVQVVNLGISGYGESPLLAEAIRSGHEQGIVYCAAAGDQRMDVKTCFPANIAECVTVSAISSDGHICFTSNHGVGIDLCAPGDGIPCFSALTQTLPDASTAAAAAHVSACAALVKSRNQSFTAQEVEEILYGHAVDYNPVGTDLHFGRGCVNMAFADDHIIGCQPPDFFQFSANHLVPYSTTYYSSETEITIESADTVYYTTDGTVPTAETGTRYTAPLTITSSMRLQAIAVAPDKSPSPVRSVKLFREDTSHKLNEAEIEVIDGVLTRYTGCSMTLSIPENVQGQIITAIGDGAFRNNKTLNCISLPDSVTRIGADAFAGCTSLYKCVCNGVTEIGAYAFAGATILRTMEIPLLTQVGEYAFAGSGMGNIGLDNLTELPEGVFQNCKFLSTISCQKATRIGAYAFDGCTSVYSADFPFSAMTEIGSCAFRNFGCHLDVLSLDALQALEPSTFAGTYICSVTLPKAITVLPSHCFDGAGIEYFTAPGVTEIDDYGLALSDEGWLVTLNLPFDRITRLGTRALTNITLEEANITFAALRTLPPYSLTACTFDSLTFSVLEHVPANGLSQVTANVISLPTVQSIDEHAIDACSALFVSEACTKMAYSAILQSSMVLYAPAGSCAADYASAHDLQLCTDRICIKLPAQVMQAQPSTPISLTARAYSRSGVVSYQWYITDADGNAAKPLTGQTNDSILIDTGSTAQAFYRCVATDDAGNVAKSGIQEINVSLAFVQPVVEGTPVTLSLAQKANEMIYRFSPERTDTYQFLLSYPQEQFSAPGFRLIDMSTGEDRPLDTQELIAGHIYHIILCNTFYAHASLRMLILSQTAAQQLESIETATPQFAPTFAYTGQAIVPTFSVDCNGKTLVAGVDFETQIYDNVGCGTASVYLFGIGSYYGCLHFTFEIQADIAPGETVQTNLCQIGGNRYRFVPKTSGRYLFSCQLDMENIPLDVLFSASWTDEEGFDIISSSTICREGNYLLVTGTLNAGVPYNLSISTDSVIFASAPCTVTLYDTPPIILARSNTTIIPEATTLSYTGKPQKPSVTVRYNETELTENKDYILQYDTNILPGNMKYEVIGIGAYCGALVNFDITIECDKADDTTQTLQPGQSIPFTPSSERVQFFRFHTQTAGQYRLCSKAEQDYDIRIYLENSDGTLQHNAQYWGAFFHDLLADQTYVIAVSQTLYNAENNPVSDVLSLFQLVEATEVSVSTPICAYTGGVVTPRFVLTFAGKALTQDTDYSITYRGDRITPGRQSVTINFMGKYLYSVNTEFYILLPPQEPQATDAVIGDNAVSITRPATAALLRFVPAHSQEYALCADALSQSTIAVTDSTGMPLLLQSPAANTFTCFLEAGKTYYIRAGFCDFTFTGSYVLTLRDTFRYLNHVEASYPATVEVDYGYIEPSVSLPFTLMDGDEVLQENVDYIVTESRNCYKSGAAAICLTGCGRYIGTLELPFDIVSPLYASDVPIALELGTESLNEYYEEPEPFMLFSCTARTAGTYRFLLATQSPACVQQFDANRQFVKTCCFSINPTTNDAFTLHLQENETVYLAISFLDVMDYSQESLSLYIWPETSPTITSGVTMNPSISYNYDATTNEIMLIEALQTDIQHLFVPAAIGQLDKIGEQPVTSIGRFAFAKCDRLDTVTLPNSITRIESFAFTSDRLKSIRIPYGCQLDPKSVGFNCYAQPIKDFVIYGYLGDYAQTYAMENGFRFIALNPNDATLARGDADANGTIDVSDAIVILRDYAGAILGRPSTLDADRRLAADVNNDGRRDTTDAVAVLRVYAASLLTGEISWPTAPHA